MPAPTDESKPSLAAGCRWGPSTKPGTPEETRMILFPEGAIKLQGTGLKILDHCDGQRTFAEIITDLQKAFGKTDPEKIRADIGMFLEQLQKKRIVDY
jgi:coenzyme PQQ biosynthesis protein PqqD